MKSGDLVSIYSPDYRPIEEFGVAIFTRRVLPSRDLSPTHDFWQSGVQDWTASMGSAWHNEVLYKGRLFLLHEMQFALVPIEKEVIERG